MLIKIVPRPLRPSVFYKNVKGVRRPPLAYEGVAIETPRRQFIDFFTESKEIFFITV